MKEKITKLIDVKTVVTFTITGVFAYLACVDKISPDKVWEAFLIIIGFYFGTQHKKAEVPADQAVDYEAKQKRRNNYGRYECNL